MNDVDLLPLTCDLLRTGIRDGWQLGGQLSVSLPGRPRVALAIGERAPGLAMNNDTPMVWASSSKPIAAVAIGQLWERGLLELDQPIAVHVPEFARHGKGEVTIRHALTHTSGIRKLDLGWPRDPWPEIIERLCSARPEPRWEAGHKAGYDRAASWFMLGELVRRIDGRAFEVYVRDEIFVPLDMIGSWIGMSESVFESRRDRLSDLFLTSPPSASGGLPTARRPARAHGWTSRERLLSCSPGVSGIGPMRELGLFYEMLLGGGKSNGPRILSPQTVEALTTPSRVGMFDQTFKHQLDWGLGFIVNTAASGSRKSWSNDSSDKPPPYGYGRLASPRTYGHSGYQSSTAFADPEHGLTVAIAVNGTPGEPRHTLRFQALTEAIYTDLGLTGE